MQYKNTVRGYKAIVDGDTDILFCAAPSETQKAYAEEQGGSLSMFRWDLKDLSSSSTKTIPWTA